MTNWAEAGVVALTGIILVFGVLGILQVAVTIMSKIFEAKARSVKKDARAQG